VCVCGLVDKENNILKSSFFSSIS